jgi:7-cyano-7-deazaguanine synthase in queuosine biosynthesis
MKVIALISGGKDSTFNMMECTKKGHEIGKKKYHLFFYSERLKLKIFLLLLKIKVALVNLRPPESLSAHNDLGTNQNKNEIVQELDSYM